MRSPRFLQTIFGHEPVRDGFANVYVNHEGDHFPGFPWPAQITADQWNRGSSRFVYRVNVRVKEEGARV